ncbi:HNHc domain containing protein [uncultured Caudovirales phage]|uniref:HNHc domain containing protein n=1 Tax=uncultured Caudovirales phage TaxID=2100421 RepID=A0A6J5LJ81_9CAUD|nr:HNHc domain containing protein [uncultured Caudovirales phage]
MINNFYLIRYNKLINHYKNVIVDGFYEKHHIIPKCLGGTNNNDNLVLLPTRVHFIAHALLYKAYPKETKLAQAFGMMVASNKHQKGRKFSSRLYEMSKSARSNSMKSVPRPEWVKEKLRVPKLNKENYKKPKSKEHSENISKSLMGKKKTQEHINNFVKSQRAFQESRTQEMIKKKNMYCDLFVKSNMSRKDFAKSQNVPFGTMKRYLRGL